MNKTAVNKNIFLYTSLISEAILLLLLATPKNYRFSYFKRNEVFEWMECKLIKIYCDEDCGCRPKVLKN